LCGVLHGEELSAKVTRSATINGNLTNFHRLKVVKGIDNTVDVGYWEIKELLVEIFIVHIALFVEMTPKVDVVDELLEFVLGHGLNTVKYGHWLFLLEFAKIVAHSSMGFIHMADALGNGHRNYGHIGVVLLGVVLELKKGCHITGNHYSTRDTVTTILD
jgi:hypothetical protein